MGILEIIAEDTVTNQQEWQNISEVPKCRVDVDGRLITSINAAPPTGRLVPGECAWWLNVATDPPEVTFTANVGGTIFSVEIPMHT